MEFQTRSKECVLADLTSKLQTLPPSHPDRPILARMIVGLRDELAPRNPHQTPTRPSGGLRSRPG
jgi:hypothetical protein